MTRTHTLPTGTMNTMNTKGTTYFTPLDTIQDHLDPVVHARLASPVLQSMTWMLNAACINKATNIMFNLYAARPDEDKPLSLVEYSGSIADVLDRDEVYNGTSDEDRACEIESDENTLAMLLGLRASWYDATRSAMLQNNGTDEQVNSWLEKNRFSIALAKAENKDISSDELALVKFDLALLTTDPAELEMLMADKVKTLLVSKEQDHADKLRLAPIKLEILRVVGKHMKHDARFDQLPLRTQSMLTSFTVGAIDRSKEDLRKRMARRESLAYMHLSLQADRAKRELDYVIKSKYNEVAELESAGSAMSHDNLDKARNAKSFAASID